MPRVSSNVVKAIISLPEREFRAFLVPVPIDKVRGMLSKAPAGQFVHQTFLAGLRPNRVTMGMALTALIRASSTSRGPEVVAELVNVWIDCNPGPLALAADFGRQSPFSGPMPAEYFDRLGLLLEPATVSAVRALIGTEPSGKSPVPSAQLEESTALTANASRDLAPTQSADRARVPPLWRSAVDRDRWCWLAGLDTYVDDLDRLLKMPQDTSSTDAWITYASAVARELEIANRPGGARVYWLAAGRLARDSDESEALHESMRGVARASAQIGGVVVDGDFDDIVATALGQRSPEVAIPSLVGLIFGSDIDANVAVDLLSDRTRSRVAALTPEMFPEFQGQIARSKGSEPAIAVVSSEFQKRLYALRRVAQELLDRPTIEQVRRVRTRLIPAVRNLRPFAFGAETEVVELTAGLLGAPFTAYEQAAEPEEDETFEKFLSGISDAIGSIHASGSYVGALLLLPILAALDRAVTDHYNGNAQGRVALLVVEPDKPAKASDTSWDFSVRIRNEGTGIATDIALIPGRHLHAKLASKNPPLARLIPGATATRPMTWIVRVGEVLSLSIPIELKYRDRAGVHSQQLELKVPRGRTADFSSFEYVGPYSIRSIDDPRLLKGRTEQLNKLRDGFRRASSFMVTGQRRVGKTSLVKVFLAELERAPETLGLYLPLGEVSATAEDPDLGRLGLELADRIVEAYELRFGSSPPASPPIGQFRDAFNSSLTGFVRTLERSHKGIRLVIALDDFDELPTPLFTGAPGRQLFLALRALMDKGVSFLFVGSERLPTLMAEQAERMNQVEKLPVDYLDLTSLNALVREPTRDVLDFEDRAVASIVEWSARSPYFATIIAATVFDRARSLNDSAVSEGDVASAVEDVLESSPRSYFQHFWSDSPRLRDEERDLEETKASLAVVGISRVQEKPFQFVNRDAAVRTTSGLNETEARTELDALVARGVVEVSRTDAHLVRFRVPLFAGWLKRHATYELSQEKALAARVLTLARQVELTAEEVTDAVRGLEYQGRPVTTDEVRSWCAQFGELDHQRLMLRLLSPVRQLGLSRLSAFLGALEAIDGMVTRHAAAQSIPMQLNRRNRLENYFVCHVDEPGKSGSVVVNRYRRHNRIYEGLAGGPTKILPLLKAQSSPGIVVCVDDFVGTGKAAAGGLLQFVSLLDKARPSWRENLLLIYAAVAGYDSGLANVEYALGDQLVVLTPHRLSDSERAFHENGNIFDDADQRLRARDLAERYGALLDRRQPLGYEDSQGLVVFDDTVPNNTLPILWKEGKVGDKVWRPLFPARMT